MICQAILGTFVFIVYVFVVPSVAASNALSQDVHPISLSLYKFLVVLGIFTSFHFCLALQGGQFVFMARMISSATNEDFLKQRSGNKLRALFWSANLALAGLWTLITGSIINGKIGSRILEEPFFFPPNVGRISGLTIVAGILMICFGFCSIATVITLRKVPSAYWILWTVVFLFVWLNFTIAQIAKVGPFFNAIAMHHGLTFTVMFLGAYFVRCWDHDSQVKQIDEPALASPQV